MSRYVAMFEQLRERGEGAFGAFLMLGDPDLETSSVLLDALVAGGADMIEVGIPFTDPIADGPVIQAAANRALGNGTRVEDCFQLLAAFRRRHSSVPVGILTYANLLAARECEQFCTESAAAGVDSLLVADVPAFEAEPYREAAQLAGIDLVMIAAPNTPLPTLARVARICSGYTYCVTRMGVTGMQDQLALQHRPLLTELSKLDAPPPILGFGISTPEQVREAIAAGAAGVICGSAIVRLASEAGAPGRISSFVATMKGATRLSEQSDTRSVRPIC